MGQSTEGDAPGQRGNDVRAWFAVRLGLSPAAFFTKQLMDVAELAGLIPDNGHPLRAAIEELFREEARAYDGDEDWIEKHRLNHFQPRVVCLSAKEALAVAEGDNPERNKLAAQVFLAGLAYVRGEILREFQSRVDELLRQLPDSKAFLFVRDTFAGLPVRGMEALVRALVESNEEIRRMREGKAQEKGEAGDSPRLGKRKRASKTETKGCVIEAINLMREGASQTDAARKAGIPESTLSKHPLFLTYKAAGPELRLDDKEAIAERLSIRRRRRKGK